MERCARASVKPTLGAYRAFKQWLSHRESAILDRPLIPDEAQQFTHHIRRITAILALLVKQDE
jgi:hypothetical protein